MRRLNLNHINLGLVLNAHNFGWRFNCRLRILSFVLLHFLIGNSSLAIISWLWNEKSLVALNTGLASIYLVGLINLFFFN